MLGPYLALLDASATALGIVTGLGELLRYRVRLVSGCWATRPASSGPSRSSALMVLGTASMSVLGYEHDLTEPVLRSWNAGKSDR